MHSTAAIIFFISAPTLAQQLAKPGRVLPSGSQFQSPGSRFQATKFPSAQGFQPQRLPPARAFAPEFAPEFAPAFDSGPVSSGSRSSGFGGSYNNPRGGGGSYTPPSAEAVQSTAGLTPEQIEFMQRQAALRGGGSYVAASGGLDTHGRPAGGASAPADSGEYAGMTPDQIEFMKRKKGEIAMSGGLDTHGRPRLLDAQEEPPSVLELLTAGLLGFFTGSAVTFAIWKWHFRHSASGVFRQPLLTA